jgi:hypothetical protein
MCMYLTMYVLHVVRSLVVTCAWVYFRVGCKNEKDGLPRSVPHTIPVCWLVQGIACYYCVAVAVYFTDVGGNLV